MSKFYKDRIGMIVYCMYSYQTIVRARDVVTSSTNGSLLSCTVDSGFLDNWEWLLLRTCYISSRENINLYSYLNAPSALLFSLS